MVLRSNSLATKAVEIYLKQVGGPYLMAALGHFVAAVVTSASPSASQQKPPSSSQQSSHQHKCRTNSLSVRHNSSTRSVINDMPHDDVIIDYEVDPERVTNSSELLRNQANLLQIVTELWLGIRNAICAFPVYVSPITTIYSDAESKQSQTLP